MNEVSKNKTCQENNKTGKIKISNFIEEIPKSVHTPYYVFWILICSILLTVMVNTSVSTEGLRLEFVLPSLIMAGAIWISISIVWSSKTLIVFSTQLSEISKSPEETYKWLCPFIEKIYSSRNLLLCGLITCIVLELLVGLYSRWLSIPYAWYNSTFSRIYFYFLWGIASFFAGAGLEVVIGTMIIPIKLSKENLRLSLHAYRKYGIRRVGNLYLKFSVIIACAACISISGVLVSPIKSALGVIVMYIVFSCISFLYFIATQWSLHSALVKEKAEILDDISEKLEQEINNLRIRENTSEDAEKRINTLLNLRKEIFSLSEWPFDASTVIRVLLSTLGPILVLLTNFWKFISQFLGFK